ncbi:MAG: polysaccharide deacetylase family protein [Caldisericia bacterium]
MDALYDLDTRALWPKIPTSDAGVLILEYHCVSNAPEGSKHPGMYIKPETFDKQMMILKNMGMKGISFVESIDELGTGNFDMSHVVLTFDDGHDDNLQVSYDLKSIDFNATFFVITGKVGKHYPNQSLFYLGWEDLRKISDLGFEIGSHTVNHIDLSAASPSRADYEISQSIKDVEDNIGKEVRTFSIPKGAYTTDVIIEISRYGLDGCVTSDRGYMNGQIVHRAPRILVEEDTDLGKILTVYLKTNLKFGIEKFVVGDSGEKIRSFRTILTRLGYPLLDSDVFDEQMELAVSTYQEALAIEPSGELNHTTIDIMVNDFMELVTSEE